MTLIQGNLQMESLMVLVLTNGQTEVFMKVILLMAKGKEREIGKGLTEISFQESTLRILRMVGVNLLGPTARYIKGNLDTICGTEKVLTSIQMAKSANSGG